MEIKTIKFGDMAYIYLWLLVKHNVVIKFQIFVHLIIFQSPNSIFQSNMPLALIDLNYQLLCIQINIKYL
jgi:hypothetical protein